MIGYWTKPLEVRANVLFVVSQRFLSHLLLVVAKLARAGIDGRSQQTTLTRARGSSATDT